jgi:hypothetical protein
MAKLTDKILAQSSAITPTTLIHIVYTGDTSQNPAGSSYKAELSQIAPTNGGYQYYSEINVSSAELLTIFSSPVTILPAPGVGKYYDFKIYAEYKYETVIYDISSVRLVDDNNIQLSPSIAINQTSDNVVVYYGLFSTSMVNSTIRLYGSSDPTVGDGTVKIKIWYNIVDFG